MPPKRGPYKPGWKPPSYERPMPKLGSRYRPPTTYVPPPLPPGKGGRRKPPQVDLANRGDTMLDLAERTGVDPVDFMAANPDMTKPMAGTAYNIPDPRLTAGWTAEEIFYDEQPGDLRVLEDFMRYQESIDVTGKKKWGQTAETTEAGIQYPEGWNPAEFRWMTEQMPEDYYDYYADMDFSRENVFDLPAMSMVGGEIDPRWQSYTTEELSEMLGQYYPDDIRGPSGIPSYHKWEQGAMGEWTPRSPEAAMDALYEMNDIDPNDDLMVEWFWSLADDDLLYMGEFFETIDWGGGGYGGGYGETPYGLGTPSRMVGQGQKPTRGNYSSYLSLTSWRI